MEVTRPGLCALATRGPARYHGGERALCRAVAEAAREAVSGACDVAEPVVRVGVADGPFAAALAARREAVVPASGTAEFLAGFPVEVLGRPELADLLVRLGIGTLGAFAALDPATVAARFGPDGALAQRLARGLDDRSLRSSAPPVELVAVVELDPPAERVDTAAFAGRTLAEDLMAQLDARGLSCTLLTIEAETEHGECLTRRWRAEDSYRPRGDGGAAALAARGVAGRHRRRGAERGDLPALVPRQRGGAGRWSPDGLLGRCLGGRPPGHPGARPAARDARPRGRLHRRAGEVAGDRATGWPSWRGGTPGPMPDEAGPWPGRHPEPAPALVHRRAPAGRGDGTGPSEPVGVSARGRLTAAPALVSVEGGPEHARSSRGPGRGSSTNGGGTPGPAAGGPGSSCWGRTGRAYLCFVERNQWWVEATYD